MSCKIRITLFMPSDSFDQLLDRAASWCGIDAGFWDILGNRHITSVAAKQTILRALGWRRIRRRIWNIRWRRSSATNGSACCRRRWSCSEPRPVELPLHVPAERLGESRAVRGAPRRRRTSEFELNLCDLPQAASAEMDGRTWVRKQPAADAASRWAITTCR